jgi:hypothetical protein
MYDRRSVAHLTLLRLDVYQLQNLHSEHPCMHLYLCQYLIILMKSLILQTGSLLYLPDFVTTHFQY